MEPGWLLADMCTVIRRAVGVVLATAAVIALGWEVFALLVALLVGQNWDVGAVLTVLGMAAGGLIGLVLAWQVWPHRARLHRHALASTPPSPSVPPLPTSPQPKSSE